VVTLAGSSLLFPLISHSFQRSILSDLNLEEMEQPGLPPERFSWLPVSPGLIFQRRNLTVLFFSRSGSFCSCRSKISMDFLTLVRSLLSLTSNGNPFAKKKLPFRYLLTVVDKQRQATVIMTVSSGRQPESCLFMKPGPVSVRFFRTCFPQTSSDQVDQVAGPEGLAV
jgi:hypothetical protein